MRKKLYIIEIIEENSNSFRCRINDRWWSPVCQTEDQAILTGLHSFSDFQKAEHNIDYTQLPDIKDLELAKCIKGVQDAVKALGNFV